MMAFTGRVVRLESDRVGSLQGLFSQSPQPSKGLVVFVHGTWGNFYGNELAQAVGEVCAMTGWDYLAANFPGHDETSMSETIDDFSSALEDWVPLVSNTAVDVVLIAHSLGALKALDYLRHGNRRLSVRAAVLLAPFDCVAFNQRESQLGPNDIDRLRANADKIVSEEVFPHWLLRQGMLADLIEPGGTWDLLPIRSGDLRSSLDAQQSSVPMWAALGSEDFAAVPDPVSVVECLRRSGAFRGVELVAGAPHNFASHLREVQMHLYAWLAELG